MLYAPINPSDLLVLENRYPWQVDAASPLGAEGVGIVEALGSDVSDLQRGQMVLPLLRGNWQSHRRLERAQVVAIPVDLPVPPVQAAMLRINPITAWLLLQASGAGPGDSLVQNGAGSSVARWIRVFAAQLAIKVIDVVRRPVSDLPGAIVDSPALAAHVRTAAGDAPLRAALDCVAGEATGRLAECLADQGRIVVFGHLSGHPLTVRSQLLTGGGLTVTGFSLRPAEARLGAEGLARLFDDLFARLRLALPDMPVARRVPVAQAFEAVAAARAGAAGRVLIDFSG